MSTYKHKFNFKTKKLNSIITDMKNTLVKCKTCQEILNICKVKKHNCNLKSNNCDYYKKNENVFFTSMNELPKMKLFDEEILQYNETVKRAFDKTDIEVIFSNYKFKPMVKYIFKFPNLYFDAFKYKSKK